jgi:hypothetical protein
MNGLKTSVFPLENGVESRFMGSYPIEGMMAIEAETYKLQSHFPCCPKLQKCN